MEKKYVVQIGTSTDSKGYVHQKSNCSLPVKAIMEMDLYHNEIEDRTVIVRYDKKTKTITIQKAKKA